VNRHGILVDTGPLVAIFSPNDAHHDDCVDALRLLRPPLLTCWPVITEAAWLLRNQPSARQNLLTSFSSGLLKLLPLDAEEVPGVAAVLDRYRNIGAQLADAALLLLADREGITTVFTLDRRDFSIYRRRGGRKFHILP
jgi:predicted nucleic acid-binding protein